ncbi:MAG TPA: energy transducer TonB [Sporomusa sp.]|nr:energy transducer TonB [Sporomusa sp.]
MPRRRKQGDFMTEYCSWRRAFLYSGLFHLAVAICFGLGFNGNIIHQPEAEYVIDLDMTDLVQGSGQAGGGTPQQAESRPETETPLEPAALSPENIAVPVSAPVASPAAAARTRMAGSSGAGTAAGDGDGAGDGRGHGEGSGYGGGTGSSGVAGTGSGAFDFNGFANAVDANKQYPYMAVKRNIQGTVTVAVKLDADGNLVSASTVGSAARMLEQAALQAISAVCPYPNALKAPVSFTTTVHFVLK